MRVLISGGCKNGKSTLAQCMAVSQGERPAYVATMLPRDAEDDARVARHRAEREGWGFETVECATGIGRLPGLVKAERSILLDSTTALLAEEMFSAEGIDLAAAERVKDELLTLAHTYGDIVFVSDTIYSDALVYDEGTQAYRRGLAMIDRALAQACDAVIEMTFGQRILHKGDESVARWLETVDARLRDGDGPVHGAAGVCPVG